MDGTACAGFTRQTRLQATALPPLLAPVIRRQSCSWPCFPDNLPDMKLLRLAFFAALCCSGMFAQDSGIQGVVTDATKAVIPNARVTVLNLATGVSREATTNAAGLFLLPLLEPGSYQVQVSSTGFALQKVNELKLETGQTARLDFELKPGSVSESIEVSAAAVLINSETTEVGQVIDSKRILEMPLNGRNYLQLAQFTAGVLPGGGLGVGARGRDEGAFAAVGMQIAQNNVLLDGNDNSSRTSGGPLGFEAQANKPSVDAVSDFKVVTNNISAEYGYRAGARIIVTTKSGTNNFHGSAYEFLRNSAFDGTNFFANRSGARKPTLRQNQYGATLGGPIRRNRTFFFGSFQRTNIRKGQSFISSLPSRALVENYEFAEQPAIRRNIFDPATLTGTGATALRQPFPGNRIPASRVDPVSAALMKIYPAPNIPGRANLPDNYFFGPSDPDDANQYDVRVDHNLNDAHRLSGRYSYRDQFRLDNGPLPAPAFGGNGQTVSLKGPNIVGSLASSLSPTMFHELRIGYSGFDTAFDIPVTENLNAQFGIKNSPGEQLNDGLPNNGYTRFTPTGFTELGPRSFWPNINNLRNYMLTDSLLVQRGRHSIKVGAEIRRLNVFRNAARFRRGQLGFSGAYTSEQPNNGVSRANTGNSLADMALGLVGGGTYGNNQGEDIVSWYYGGFVQDDFKVSNRLTINAGIRYELFRKGIFPDLQRQSIGRYNVATEAFEYPDSSGNCGCANDRNNWAPRLGLAYQLSAKTVLRTGAGIFYGEPNSLSTDGANYRSGAPRSQDVSIQQNLETTNFLVRNGFPAFSNTTISRGIEVFVFPNLRPNLYAAQWYMDLQRTLPGEVLLTVGYIGTKSTHLSMNRNINLPLTPSATVPANSRFIRPQFGAVTYHDTGLNASYNAMTAKAERRFNSGFTLLSSFTWSHNIDYGNEDLLDGSPGPVTPYELSREKASSNLDRRLGFVSSMVYELPFGQGKRFLTAGVGKWLAGGWQISGLLSATSGFMLTNSINVNNQNLGGAVRGDWLRNPNLPVAERTIDRWFDTGFAVAAAPGTIANIGRNLIEGPGRRNLDLSIARTFRLPFEGHTLQFRAEGFNALNTPNFGQPNTAVGTPTVGRIVSAEDPRRIQFALKYTF
jgi:hypothetical protein